jgi:hypothetical protein
MNDDRFDFSGLDPARDAERWEQRIRQVVAHAARARRWTVSAQLTRWARPALGLAAAAALFSGLGLIVIMGSLDQGSLDPGSRAQEAPSAILSRWAATDEAPSTRRLLTVLGEQ